MDLDEDGDLDLMVEETYGNFLYFQNTGSSSSPNFATPQADPFDLTHPTGNPYQYGTTFVDFDDDGDQDILGGTFSPSFGSFFYYENLGVPSSIEAKSKDELRFELYPQPASEILHIRYEGDERIDMLSIMDMQGRTVLNEAMGNDASNERTLQVSSLKPGIYLLKARAKDKTFTQRMMIE